MALESGTKLGPYEVLSPIGAGGMGEVYLANDGKLDRKVAIKVLPELMTRDKERVARFEREAKLLASLNHPNIAAIHGFDDLDGIRFLVMEYVEGKTLGDLLRSGPVAVEDALDIAKQIAEALEAAHEKGVIHRDLKPGNVMIRPDGSVKVLDFGLAKAMAEEPSGAGDANSPTITANYTRPGVVLGTAAYMSPEQARGKPLDKRTDIWSFGCVLYECLTGKRPFVGETKSDTIAKILERDPDFERLPHNTPLAIRSLLHHCLQKDRKRRFRDIGDAVIELDEAISTRAWSTTAIHAVRSYDSRRTLKFTGMIVAIVVLLMVFSYAAWRIGRNSVDSVSSFSKATFTKLTDQPGAEFFPSLSPEGKTIVYASRVTGNWDIYSLRVGGFNPVNLTSRYPEHDTQPAFSPDGESVVFRSERLGGGIFVMGATGESPRRLTDFGFNPTWSPDGQDVLLATEGITHPLSRNITSELWTVNVNTGEMRRIYAGDAVQPHWSPYGHRIAYWTTTVGGGQRDIFTIPSEGGEPVPITNDPATDWNPVWSPDGNYLYFCSDRGGTMNLWRVRIDERTGNVMGKFESVTSGVVADSQHLSLSRDGRRITFVSSVVTANIQQVAFDPASGKIQGEPVSITRGSSRVGHPHPIPNGQWLVYASKGEREDIFIIKTDGSDRRQLTNDIHKDRAPRWSPDGSRIAFYSDRSGSYEIWTINPDGSGMEKQTDTPGRNIWYPIWSPDGSRLSYYDPEGETILEIGKPWDKQTLQSLPSTGNEDDSFVGRSWSPDGNRLAFDVFQAGVSTGVAIFSFRTDKYDRLTDRGASPVWLRDSRRLIFHHEDKLFLCDTATREINELLSISPHVFGDGLSMQSDGKGIYFSLERTDADIWLIELE